MKKLNLVSAAIVSTLLLGGVAVAADGPHDKAIKARQAMFQLYSYHVGILGDMAKGKMDYDAAIASEVAKNLEAATHLGQSTFWPVGSDNSNDANARTRALKGIWENFPDVAKHSENLKTATAALAQTAGNGVEALQAGMGDIGASCKGCHDDFRAKKK